jgi:phage shock protein PspC (stress-responsive transcriptional regulator)
MEIIFAFFILSGVFAWGFIAYILINLFMGDK